MTSYLIFAADRTGSTTLSHMLSLLPNLDCVTEPFNHQNPNFLKPETEGELRSDLDMLYRTYAGIKHVWFSTGWPFPSMSFHDVVLTHHRKRVILLNRRNVLQRAVSYHVAIQTKVWHVSGVNDPHRRRIESNEIAPIDPDWIRGYIDGQHSEAERYRNMLASLGDDWMDLHYEDLYNPSMDVDARFHAFSEIVDFLGGGSIGDEEQSIKRLLDPRFSKMNSSTTYRQIPNIDEIERVFGNAENGYLTDTTAPPPTKPSIMRGAGVEAVDPIELTEPEKTAALASQVKYLEGVVKTQNEALRKSEQRLTTPAVRLAGGIDRTWNRLRKRP